LHQENVVKAQGW